MMMLKDSPNKDETYYVKVGWRVLIIGFVGFMLWASLAPIDKGISVPGTVITDGHIRPIQSISGGLIEEVLVQEGQKVTEGELLIRINSTNANAQSNATKEIIIGLESQAHHLLKSVQAKQAEKKLLAEQVKGAKELVVQEYIPKNRLLDLQRSEQQLISSLANDQGTLEKTKQQIKELKEKLTSAEFDLAQTEIKSPINGTVVGLTIFSKGAVIQPSNKMMDILPNDKELIVEGKIPVHLIDKAILGLPVEIRFTAFNANSTPTIEGTLTTVSADRLVEPKTDMPYYKAYVKVTEKSLKKLKNHEIKAGMSSELFIKTGERSLLNYLLKPLFDRTHSAMREE